MTTSNVPRSSDTRRTKPGGGSRSWEVSTGWTLVASALVLVGYIVVAVILGADYEQDLVQAADRAGVAVNALDAAAQARVVHDHKVYAAITAAFLFLPPLLLARATVRIRSELAERMAVLSWWTALASLVVWWAYLGLSLGLFADPDNLPPLVRDFGPLTVPMVTTMSMLALASLGLAGEAVRRGNLARRSALVTTSLSLLIGVLSLAGSAMGGFQDPVPPIVIVPGGLILGIALVRSQRKRVVATRAG